mgnify:CR=1 FL=1
MAIVDIREYVQWGNYMRGLASISCEPFGLSDKVYYMCADESSI